MSKQEIEEVLQGKGDFVQIDYLTKFIKEGISINMKKFVFLKLAVIYERMGVFNDCAKMFDNLALNSVIFSEKIEYYTKEAKLYIKAGAFDKADEAMQKAMNQANATQKQEIYFVVKDFYKKQAEIYERELKRAHAVRIYEKLLEMKIRDLERQEIKKKLLRLYEKLGKFEEYHILKNDLDEE